MTKSISVMAAFMKEMARSFSLKQIIPTMIASIWMESVTEETMA